MTGLERESEERMDARDKHCVKYALAMYRYQMGFRGPVTSGFDWIPRRDKETIEAIVAERVSEDREWMASSREEGAA